MPIQYDSIAAVLHQPGFEGPQQLRGYIPCIRSAAPLLFSVDSGTILSSSLLPQSVPDQ